ARHIGFAEFAWVGVPLVIGTIAIAVLFGEKLLPNRTAAVMPPDLSRLATTLAKQYTIHSGLVRLRVGAESNLDGASRGEVVDALPAGAELRGIERDGQDPGDTPIRAGDVLVVDAEDAQLADFLDDNALTPCRSFDGPHPDELIGSEYGVAEVIIPPRSEFVGHMVFPGMATSRGDLVVLAAQRGGRDLGSRPQRLEAGDTLLLRGSWRALDQHIAAPQVRVVHEPELIRRQTLP